MRRLTSFPWVLPFVVITMTLLAALPLLLYPLGRDQGMYANIGRTIVDGGLPYINMWDIKPPPIYYLYASAIALFGHSTSAVHALDLLLMPIAMLAIHALGTALSNRRTGAMAALLFGVFIFSDSFENITQSDSLALVPACLAAWCTYKAANLPRASRSAIAYSLMTGLLCGVLLWFKQYYAFFVLALVINQVWQRRALPIKEAWAFAIGGLITGGGLLLYFGANGIIEEMLIVAQGTAAYNAQGYSVDEFLFGMGNGLMSRFNRWGSLILLALLWLPFSWRESRKPGWRLIVLWWLAGLAFLLIQAKGFDTHWLLMLPPLALFGADALDQLVRRLSTVRYRAPLQAIIGILFLGILVWNTWIPALPWLTGQETQIEYYENFVAGDLRPAESLEVVQYLQERHSPDDSIFIYGFRPEVAFMGQWRPATRFQAQFPLVAPWYPASWRDENVSILWGAMPPYVLILQNDYMPWVTNYDLDSHQLLQEDVELNNWLMANYERETMIGNFFIWRRRT